MQFATRKDQFTHGQRRLISILRTGPKDIQFHGSTIYQIGTHFGDRHAVDSLLLRGIIGQRLDGMWNLTGGHEWL
jgi:hypothetical protein